MPSSWADSVMEAEESEFATPTRPNRSSSYIPPHLRNKNLSPIDTSHNAPWPNRSNSREFGSGRGVFSRPGRGRGDRGRNREPNPFEIADKFAELEVSSEQEVGGGGINFDAYEDIPVETSGAEVPPPVNTFAEIDLGDALNHNIQRCKYVKPTPVQRYAIPISLAGRDLMACAQTGSGKTAAFCFPIISGIMNIWPPQLPPRGTRTAYPLALILSPTRELSCQIHEEAKKFSYQTGVKVVVAYGGAPIHQQRLASDFLSNYIFLAVGRVGSSTDLIAQRVEFVQEMDKRSYLMDLLLAQRENGAPGKVLAFAIAQALTLVFVETKRGADSLEHWLCKNGFPATAIHGDRTQPEREQALRSFKSGTTPIMVATDVAARGLDIPHVSHVINFDLPKDINDYVHRIGRTGRAGKSGLATAFFNEGNQPLAKPLSELMREANQEVPPWLNLYAERSSYSGGRHHRSGRGRFGGHDYRRDPPSRGGNYYYNSYSGGGRGSSGRSVLYPSPGYGLGRGSIVAGGWN
ncbi:DEAD-box ATP-dependent RNA helicase 37-like isoform X3 [Tasmannia lanceolata]|uniref:DEAD-box ATP-dependent RNA helicase 37-like isoform X3 n=1 Tax=Tasmannia lanceolata TaxID=3420 RepID=UPI0040645B89